MDSVGKQLTKVIKKWRKERREAGKEISGKLERRNRPPLNLNTATDEEIEEWLSQQ